MYNMTSLFIIGSGNIRITLQYSSKITEKESYLYFFASFFFFCEFVEQTDKDAKSVTHEIFHRNEHQNA